MEQNLNSIRAGNSDFLILFFYSLVMCSRAMRATIFACILLAGCAESKIDSCLDQGGSFNYEKCECDFKENHEYKESHSC